jgi:hypothetical protein
MHIVRHRNVWVKLAVCVGSLPVERVLGEVSNRWTIREPKCTMATRLSKFLALRWFSTSTTSLSLAQKHILVNDSRFLRIVPERLSRRLRRYSCAD